MTIGEKRRKRKGGQENRSERRKTGIERGRKD